MSIEEIVELHHQTVQDADLEVEKLNDRLRVGTWIAGAIILFLSIAVAFIVLFATGADKPLPYGEPPYVQR